MPSRPAWEQRPGFRRPAPWIGVGGHVAVGWLYLVSWLVAPWYGVVFLAVSWVGLLILALRWFSRRPYWALAVPLVSLAWWFLVVAVGDAWLGWAA